MCKKQVSFIYVFVYNCLKGQTGTYGNFEFFFPFPENSFEYTPIEYSWKKKVNRTSKFPFIDDFRLFPWNRFYFGVFTSKLVMLVVIRLLFLFWIQWKQKKVLKIAKIQENEPVQARSHSKKSPRTGNV